MSRKNKIIQCFGPNKGQVRNARKITLYTCCICEKEGQWDERWSWYGSMEDMDNGTERLACSDECKKKLKESIE